MKKALKNLMDSIRSKEAPKGYAQIYSSAKGVPKGTNITKMKLNDIVVLQRAMIKAGSKSTASGGFQFIKNTLIATIREMGLTGEEVWTPDLQDLMAMHLVEKRGLNSYLRGDISAETFCNNLAKEWASLPVVTAIKGAHRMLVPGQSYYAGDGLNKSFHDPKDILKLVRALKENDILVSKTVLSGPELITKEPIMSTITVEVPKAATGKEVVVVSTPFWSKINWTQFVGAIAMFGTYFGIDLSPEVQTQVVLAIGGVTQLLTWALRTFFTNKQPSIG